jgi:filamentous hemagglutinin family protein
LLAAAAFILPWTAFGQVVTDGSLGPEVSLSGARVEVGAELGQIRGRNLFHSFERLNVQNRGRVTFSGPPGLRNVVSRVTGREPSRINGTLASTIDGADLFLLNPNGVVFGPNGRLDVRGSFHVSTADELRMQDGAAFSARDTGTSGLTVAEPAAFGFLGGTPRPITVDRAVLRVPDGQGLSLIGGDVLVRARASGSGVVRTPAGRVQVGAYAGTGTVALDGSPPTADVSGRVVMDGRGRIDSSGAGGGIVVIRGGEITLADTGPDAPEVHADNTSAVDATGGIRIEGGTFVMTGFAAVQADAMAAGRAGTIEVRADEVHLRERGRIRARSGINATGDAGVISIEARELVIGTIRAAEFAGLQSTTLAGSSGDGAEVRVTADHIKLENRGQITASTIAAGNAGAIILEAGSIEVVTGGRITSETSGRGDAGAVSIVTDSLLIDGIAGNTNSRIGTEALRGSSGRAGSVSIDAAEIVLRNGGGVRTDTLAAGDAGDVVVKAGGLVIDGDASQLASVAGAPSSGRAGSVSIDAAEIVLRNGGGVRTDTLAAGDAGDVVVKAGSLLVDGDNSQIASGAAAGSSGRAGLIEVDAADVALQRGGRITTSSAGRGKAGTVRVQAGSVRVDGSDSGIISEASGQAGVNAGTVTVTAADAALRHGGRVSSRNTGRGDAGTVTIVAARELSLGDGAAITTEAANGGGGSITARAGELLRLEDGSRITTSIVGKASETAGNILAAGRFVVLQGKSSIQANAPGGIGGNILIAADRLLREPGARIEATGAVQSGTVVTTTAEVDLTSGLVVLPTAFLGVDQLLQESCAARGGEQVSSFTGVGRGGLPPSPEQPLGVAYLAPGEALAAGAHGCGAPVTAR